MQLPTNNKFLQVMRVPPSERYLPNRESRLAKGRKDERHIGECGITGILTWDAAAIVSTSTNT